MPSSAGTQRPLLSIRPVELAIANPISSVTFSDTFLSLTTGFPDQG